MRDASLDGWVVHGVVTTRIYCRPSCPARPKPENVRRFESTAAARAAGMRACKRCTPDELDVELRGAVVKHLEYRAPLEADALIEFFGRRAVPGIEELDGDVFRRSLRLPRGNGVAELRALPDGLVAARLWLDDPRDHDAAVARCRALLDLDAEPQAVVDALGGDELLGPLVRTAPGRRVPGAADGNELAVRAVLGQQVSLPGAATLAGRLVAAHGRTLERPVGAVTHVFPTAAALASADPTGWAMPASRRRALAAVTTALAAGDISLDPAADHDEATRLLLELPGIGPWTAGYIAMRALRDADAFLPNDLGVRRALERLGRDGTPKAAEALSQSWRPFRSYALQHLWAAA